MKGLDALVLAARDAGVQAITYVPGYPITDAAVALGAEISVNEKVALEIALGASATGSRALVLAKQLGMNILADPPGDLGHSWHRLWGSSDGRR